MGGGARLDSGVVDRPRVLRAFSHGGNPSPPSARTGSCVRAGAEVGEPCGIVGEIEQHRPITPPPDVFPSVGAHHDGAEVAARGRGSGGRRGNE